MSYPKVTIHKTESGLYRHKRDGKFFGSYYALYSYRGQRIKESLDTEVLAEARRLLRLRRAEDERLDPTLRASTLGEYCDKYWKTRQGKSAGTLESDLRHLNRIKNEFPGGAGRALRTIRASEVLAFIGSLKQQRNPKEPLGATDRSHLGWTSSLSVEVDGTQRASITTSFTKGNKVAFNGRQNLDGQLGQIDIFDTQIVPEPSSLSLLLAGGALLMSGRRRKL